MCGLIFIQQAELWASALSANLSRAGRNKGALTITNISVCDGAFSASPTVVTTVADVDAASAPAQPAVAHLQAPTSADSKPHPVVVADGAVRFWHNGIIQPESIAALKTLYPDASSWDTELLARHCAAKGFAGLNEVRGSFACIVLDGDRLVAFRNSLAPLYTNGFDLSSTPLGNNWEMIPSGVVMELSPWSPHVWQATDETFKTVGDPYGIKESLT